MTIALILVGLVAVIALSVAVWCHRELREARKGIDGWAFRSVGERISNNALSGNHRYAQYAAWREDFVRGLYDYLGIEEKYVAEVPARHLLVKRGKNK